MKNQQRIYKNLNLILAVVLLVSLVFCTLSYSKCYVGSPSGKKTMLHVQVIKGYDTFTGKFNPPVRLPESFETVDPKYGLFNFDRFRYMYMGLIGFVALNALFLVFRKRILAVIFLSLGFLTAIACLTYFDGFHNYYAEAVGERFYVSKTSDTDFGWLSNLFFWLLFVITLFFNWATAFDARKKKSNTGLLDN